MQFRYTKIQAQGRSRHARSSQSSPEKHARAHAEESPPWPLVTRHTLSSERHQSSDWQLEQTNTRHKIVPEARDNLQITKVFRRLRVLRLGEPTDHAEDLLQLRSPLGASGLFGSRSLLATGRTFTTTHDCLPSPAGVGGRVGSSVYNICS